MNLPEFWIIDDDVLYVQELVKALSTELEGFTVVRFTHSSPVLEASSRQPPKLPAGAIVDMMLAHDEWDNPREWPLEDNPAKNGIATVKALIDGGLPTSQIGVITAVEKIAHLEPLFAAGLAKQNLLFKPAPVSDIRNLVGRIVQAHRRVALGRR